MHLRTLSSVLAAATVALLAPAASASQCAEDLILLEPTNVEITIEPDAYCLEVEAISSGCGDQVALRLQNDCEVSAFVSTQTGVCESETCEVPAGGHFFIYLDETEGHVDISFALTIFDEEREVSASFDIDELPPEEHIHDHDDIVEGCSAAGQPGGGAGGLPLAALVVAAALGLRAKGRAGASPSNAPRR